MGTIALGEFERMVLLGVLKLGDEAYGVEICGLLERAARRPVSRGAVYNTLDRLETKGFVRWSVAGSSPDRRGLPRRRFEVCPDGMAALRDAERTFAFLRRGVTEALRGN